VRNDKSRHKKMSRTASRRNRNHEVFGKLAPADEAGEWAEETLAGLTLEKKIGQMICTDISGGDIAEGDPKLRQEVELLASGYLMR
jgi:hypothetical protein